MEKSSGIRQSMEQLLKNMEEYACVLEEIRSSMESVGASSQESSAEIIHLSGLLAAIDEEMRNIQADVTETFSAISVMSRELNNYRV